MTKLPTNCPVCQGPVEITEVSCRACDVQISGHFESNRYARLSSEHANFLETFLRCRGVIRDMETALGISYPTVRSRLDALLVALDLDSPALPANATPVVDAATRRKDILKAISEGRIDPDEGLREIQALNL
jgi:hypothetical protein